MKRLDPNLIPNTKLNSKYIKDLNVRPKTKLFEENKRRSFVIGLGKDFLDLTLKT